MVGVGGENIIRCMPSSISIIPWLTFDLVHVSDIMVVALKNSSGLKDMSQGTYVVMLPAEFTPLQFSSLSRKVS